MNTKSSAHPLHKNPNFFLLSGLVLLVGAAFLIRFFACSDAAQSDMIVIRYNNTELLRVSASQTRDVVIRDGKIVDEATGTGEENVLHIGDDGVVMASANCSNQACIKQGCVNAENLTSRPLGAWIICAPHGVTVEYVKGDS